LFNDNLGVAVGKGGEFSLAWRPTDDVTFGFIGAYTDTAFEAVVSIPNGSPIVRAGDHLPASPWNLDWSAEYAWLATSRTPYLRLDYQLATAQRSLTPYLDPANAPFNDDPTLPGLPEIRLLAIRAGLRFGGFDVSAFAQNLLNFHTPTVVSRDAATTPDNGYPVNYDTNYYGRGYAPRTIGVTATYRY
jgi:hypothetical protein